MPLSTFFNLPAEKRQKILDCAISEFAQHDYDSASISKIVTQAGIAKGSLYQYFADKRDLYHFLLELAAQKKAELLAKSAPVEPGMGLFERLGGLFQQMAQFQFLYPDLARIGQRAVYGQDPLPEDILAGATQATRAHFGALIEAGKQRGEVRAEVDASSAAFLLTAALAELNDFIAAKFNIAPAGLVSEQNYPAYEAEVARIYQQIVAILQHGIAV